MHEYTPRKVEKERDGGGAGGRVRNTQCALNVIKTVSTREMKHTVGLSGHRSNSRSVSSLSSAAAAESSSTMPAEEDG